MSTARRIRQVEHLRIRALAAGHMELVRQLHAPDYQPQIAQGLDARPLRCLEHLC